MNTHCHSCGAQVDADKARLRSSLCPQCGKDLRVCLNCRFYSPGAHWDCAESIGEAVRDKDRANFCDWFSPRPFKGTGPESAPGSESQGGQDRAGQARKAFEDLFG